MASGPACRRAAAGIIGGALGLAFLGSACSPADPTSPGAAGELTVFAASSLRDPMEDAAAAYARSAGVRIVLATDSSTALRIQIEEGAKADVYLAADVGNPRALATAGLTVGDVVVFATNQLAIVVPAGNPAGLATPADLARPGVDIVAAGDQVPITAYARQLLERLAAIPGYPRDFAAACTANVVTREDNVGAVLAKIELGEGDAAIVYASDARGSDAVDVLSIPREANVTAEYGGVLLAGTAGRVAAQAFLDWLAGPDGQAIFRSHGFATAP